MKYLFNKINGEELCIEFDGRDYFLSSHKNHSDSGGLAIVNLDFKFDDSNLLKQIALFPSTSRINITSRGTAKFYQEISQTDSAWDAEEAVVGTHDDWTITGLFSVNIQIDSQNRLGHFRFEGEPFDCPYRPRGWGFTDQRSRLKPSEQNVTHLINPWGYMIYNSGDVTVRYSDNIAHSILTSSDEPMYFTPEKDVPGYVTTCGLNTGNYDSSGAVSKEMTKTDFERNLEDYIKCPICFPIIE